MFKGVYSMLLGMSDLISHDQIMCGFHCIVKVPANYGAAIAVSMAYVQILNTFNSREIDLFIPGVDVVGGFSICSPPHQLATEQTIRLAIKSSFHPPAQWMCSKCQIGDVVSLRVGGDYYYDLLPNESVRDLLFIAGGIGINPILSMMQHHVYLQAQGSHSRSPICQLLYSGRTVDDLVFHEELTGMAQQNCNIFVDFHVTRELPTSAHDNDFKYRRISRDDLGMCLSRLPSTAVNNILCYLCGPQHMVDEVTTTLQQLGLPLSNINTEKWW